MWQPVNWTTIFLQYVFVQYLLPYWVAAQDIGSDGKLVRCCIKEKTQNSGGSNLQHQTAKLYGNLLGLPTNAKPKNWLILVKLKLGGFKLKEKPHYTWRKP